MYVKLFVFSLCLYLFHFTLFFSLSLFQSFIVKSIERNIDCVYIARQKILDLACTTLSRPAQLQHHSSPVVQTMEQIEEVTGMSTDYVIKY